MVSIENFDDIYQNIKYKNKEIIISLIPLLIHRFLQETHSRVDRFCI